MTVSPKRRHEYNQRWYYKDHEKIKVYNREYRKEWNRKNPEKVKENRLKWKLLHPEYRKEYYKLHRKANRDYCRKWRRNHPEKTTIYVNKHRHKGFILLVPNIFNQLIDWHHISPNCPYVVALPRCIHRAVLGKNHYVYNAGMTSLLYGLDINSR